MKYVRVWAQVGILYVFALVCNEIARCWQLGIQGSVIGIIALYLLLEWKVIPLKWIEAGANFLIAEMLLFFVPSAVGVMRYSDLMLKQGGEFLLIIVVSTLLVMVYVGWMSEWLLGIREKR
ncbi:Hypothetical protein LUCI_2241 [Lucifera butyrica]|uniref:LrgA n=1 Tax=Lucifera butyrica TaxID=1351585 RepID=A0A498R7V5_9FIRM|nr:CidA/LrgA family holin-like protein [Lucifera butyrica]VBB06997.1 Hypothetical protein LUCI_2241 [Lucifera butyrica]